MKPASQGPRPGNQTRFGAHRGLAGRLAVLLLVGALNLSAAPKPNLVFIFADDQCFDTIRALGNREVQTPNLDRLVNSGLTFTHAYNMGSWSGAVCVASRTMLNTGRFVWRAAKVYKTAEQERQAGRFWSEHLKQAGYDTYMTGKWHVTADASKAFDYVADIRGGMPKQTEEGYNRPLEGRPDVWSPYDKKFGGFWEGGKHWSEVLRDDARGFLEQAAQREKPFFMYLAFNAAHDPRQSPREYVDLYPADQIKVPASFLPEYPYKDGMGCGKDLRDERLAPFPRTPYSIRVNRQEYYALITHMDHQIGLILEALEKSGKADNTWIFFTADNGLAIGHHGLMGKQNQYDDSVRVPFIVKGPGVPKGKRIDAPIYLQDVMPTTLELAGVPRPEHVEFQSLLPLIKGKTGKSAYDAVYGGYLELQRAVTCEGYKLILYPKLQKARLFDLKRDPLEMKDLADTATAKPIMKKLFAKFLDLQKQTGDELEVKGVFPGLL